MRQIPIKQAKTILKQLLKEKRTAKVVLLTKKKDRLLTVEIKPTGMQLIEQGYLDQTKLLKFDGAKHVLRQAFKREFPRSHQLYISETD